MIPSLDESPDPRSSLEAWNKRLAFETKLRAMLLSQPPVPEDGRKLATIDFQRIPIAAVIQNNFDEAGAMAFEAAAAGAAAVVSTGFPQGQVVLSWPDGTTYRVPGGGPPLSPMDWLRAVACGLIARDPDSLALLCAPPGIAAAQVPEHLADPFWPFLCAAVAAVIQRPSAAAEWLKEVTPLLGRDQIRCARPEMVQMQIAPLLPLLYALSALGVSSDWHAAACSALESYKTYFTNHGAPGDPQRLLPIVIAGLTALALDRGVTNSDDALPGPLVRGEFPRAPVELTYDYPPRFAERVEDPMTLLDLEKAPSQGRQHVILERSGQMVARYRLDPRPGMPRATIDFILAGEHDERGDLPPALDAGERVLAADHYARQAGDSQRQARPFLQDAIEQLDLVLKGIPPGAESVPQAAFVNPASRRVLREEPGRFRRDRLAAYRDKLRERLAELSGDTEEPPRPETSSEIQAYAAAIAAAELVRQGVAPILAELARPHAPQVVASLRPQFEDYDRVFEPEALEVARTAYQSMWDKGINVEPPSVGHTELQIFVAPAGMLRGPNELSRPFPSGYRGIAHLLKPERVWVAWKYVKPGESCGFAYDGIVWCGDHWAWFPKPYRILR